MNLKTFFKYRERKTNKFNKFFETQAANSQSKKTKLNNISLS